MDKFNHRELTLIIEGLQCRRCYIETGTGYLTAKDVENQGQSVRALSLDQMRMVVEHEDLLTKLYQMRQGIK